MPKFFIAAILRLPFPNPADFHASSSIHGFPVARAGRIGRSWPLPGPPICHNQWG
jgi:hypothetical protein